MSQHSMKGGCCYTRELEHVWVVKEKCLQIRIELDEKHSIPIDSKFIVYAHFYLFSLALYPYTG
jgi:hypothetical protein